MAVAEAFQPTIGRRWGRPGVRAAARAASRRDLAAAGLLVLVTVL
ncbi:MAG: hypothetical protein QOK26_2434, partial [Pseudonocardiales bacterium]|nr:hypothetical protein [Pseudonocardiales bacterium]